MTVRTLATFAGLSLFASLAAAELAEVALATKSVPSPVKVSVLTPPDYKGSGRTYPLFLWLHGGGGDNGFLRNFAPVFEEMWVAGEAPEMVVATPDADRSLYMDYKDGSQKWETFIVKELVPHMREHYRVNADRSTTFIGGISMGGMGSLRMGLKYPDIFGVIVSMEPGIEPNFAWKDVQLQDKFWRAQGFLEEKFGSPIDEPYWAANNPATIARDNSGKLRESGPKIYIEVGSEDAFGLDRGTDFLHRVLYDNGIKHEYRYVLGADHVGKSVMPRARDGFRFLQRVLTPPEPDPTLDATRKQIENWKKAAGLME